MRETLSRCLRYRFCACTPAQPVLVTPHASAGTYPEPRRVRGFAFLAPPARLGLPD
jgi:hypothetical protein